MCSRQRCWGPRRQRIASGSPGLRTSRTWPLCRALNLLEDLPPVTLPHRIEHFQRVHPADLDRAGRAGIILSIQPAHLFTDIPLIERHWADCAAGAYAFKSLLQSGARLVFGSEHIEPGSGRWSGWASRTSRARVRCRPRGVVHGSRSGAGRWRGGARRSRGADCSGRRSCDAGLAEVH
jgi:hypothetical protein